MTITEFENWISNLRVARTIIYLQQHHTFSPNYDLFNGNNHFDLQKGMKNHHINSNGWRDIGQHFSIFPDGTILTGRSLELSPACIFGINANAICIENVGNFDIGHDQMTAEQSDSILRATAAICKRFSIPTNTDKVVYHHWFDLSSGNRNDGNGDNNKSCPGTNFFGGNKVADCQANFLPLVQNLISGNLVNPVILKYVCVTSNTLNVRTQADANATKATDRAAATLGSILRVFQEQNGWYKISNSQNHWVSGQYTVDVRRASVNANSLNVRNAPKSNALKISAVTAGQELFVFEQSNDWSKISIEEKWVKTEFLNFV